jgi:hypothetical protein
MFTCKPFICTQEVNLGKFENYWNCNGWWILVIAFVTVIAKNYFEYFLYYIYEAAKYESLECRISYGYIGYSVTIYMLYNILLNFVLYWILSLVSNTLLINKYTDVKNRKTSQFYFLIIVYCTFHFKKCKQL